MYLTDKILLVTNKMLPLTYEIMQQTDKMLLMTNNILSLTYEIM